MDLQKKNQLTLSVFFSPDGVFDIREKGHRRRVTEFLKNLEIDKVYLSTAVEKNIDFKFMKELKTHFEKNGFIVSGGQIPLRYMKGMFDEQVDFAGRKLGKPCLSDKRNLKLIRKSFTDVAKLFDEYILDDHFYMDCYCKKCIDLFNLQYQQDVTRESFVKMVLNSEQRYKVVENWIEFREKQMMDCVENLCVKPSRKTHPRIQLVFKVAEWYERYRIRGVNMQRISKHFDHICAGTESRELTERYGSYFIVRYNKSLCGDRKVDRAWIDDLGGYNFSMPLEPGAYTDLARNSLLAGIQELILWCYPTIYQPDRQPTMNKFKSVIPELREIYKSVNQSKPHSLPAIATHNTRSIFSSETYLFDVLGGLGIPVEPINLSGIKSINCLLFPVHGILSEYKEPVLNYVKKGGTLIITSESARMLGQGSWGKDGLELLGITSGSAGIGIKKIVQVTAFVSSDEPKILHPINHRRCSTVPIQPVFTLEKSKPIILGESEEQRIPVIFENRVGKGKVVVCCITEFPPYLKSYYPEIVRDTFRELVFQEIGIRTKATGHSAASFGNFVEPGYQEGIAVFPFKNGYFALVNLNHVTFETEVHIGKKFSSVNNPQFYSLITRKDYSVRKEKERWIIKCRLGPHQMELIRI